MIKSKKKLSDVLKPCFFFYLLIFWLDFLSYTNSRYVVYILVGIMAIVSYVKSEDSKYRRNPLIVISSVFFSIIILASNYDLFSLPMLNGLKGLNSSFKLIIAIFCGINLIISSFVICDVSLSYILKKTLKFSIMPKKKEKLSKLFFALFVSISFVYLMVLVFCSYPGIISPDSLWQVQQCINGITSNHHPVAHTLLIKLFFNIGLCLFRTTNAGIFTYCIFQILLLSFSISYMLITIYEMSDLSKKGLIVLATIISLLPYNVVYSFTIWKDVVFACFTLIFTVSLFRIVNGYSKIEDEILSPIGGIGMCLLRSNGLFAYAITLIIILALYRKKLAKRIALLVGVLLISLAIKYPVYNYFGIEQPSIVESLSIPLQNIGRTIVDEGNTIYKEEYLYLNKVLDTNKVKDVYTSYISDPMKNLVNKNGADYISNNKTEFVSFWFSLGTKHPKPYLYSWIDQTKGYWNGGYHYGWFFQEELQNEIGYKIKPLFPIFRTMLIGYLGTFSRLPVFPLVTSIGLCTWIIGIMCIISLLKKNKNIIVAVPSLAVLLSLLICTPVFSEFRYAYSLFISFPIIIFSTFYDTNNNT